MHAKIFSATTIGIEAHTVEVEVDLSYGMLQFFIVGLPDAAIKESRQRIQTIEQGACAGKSDRVAVWFEADYRASLRSRGR